MGEAAGPNYWSAPERAWIDPYHQGYGHKPEGLDAVEYVRADAAQAEVARLREEVKRLDRLGNLLAGALSATPGYTHRHPIEVRQEFERYAAEEGRDE